MDGEFKSRNRTTATAFSLPRRVGLDIRRRPPDRLVSLAASLRSMPTAVSEVLKTPSAGADSASGTREHMFAKNILQITKVCVRAPRASSRISVPTAPIPRLEARNRNLDPKWPHKSLFNFKTLSQNHSGKNLLGIGTCHDAFWCRGPLVFISGNQITEKCRAP